MLPPPASSMSTTNKQTATRWPRVHAPGGKSHGADLGLFWALPAAEGWRRRFTLNTDMRARASLICMRQSTTCATHCNTITEAVKTATVYKHWPARRVCVLHASVAAASGQHGCAYSSACHAAPVPDLHLRVSSMIHRAAQHCDGCSHAVARRACTHACSPMCACMPTTQGCACLPGPA